MCLTFPILTPWAYTHFLERKFWIPVLNVWGVKTLSSIDKKIWTKTQSKKNYKLYYILVTEVFYNSEKFMAHNWETPDLPKG